MVEAVLAVVLAVGVLAAAASAAAPGPREAGPPGPAPVGPVAVVDGCGAADRWCLAFPDGCSASNACSTVVTVRKDPAPGSDKYLFNMAATYTGYVAIALAQTTSMGEDSAVECVYDSSRKQMLLYQSVNRALNPATGRKGNTRLPAEAQKGVSLVAGKLEDGAISCSFLRDRVTSVNGTQYDLSQGSWILQAAAGNRLGNDSSIKHHVEWVVSPEKVKLFEPSGLIQGSYGLRRPPKTNAAGPFAAPTTVTILTAFITHCVLQYHYLLFC